MKLTNFAGLVLVLGLLPQLASAGGFFNTKCSIADDVVSEGIRIRVLLDTANTIGFMKGSDRSVFCGKMLPRSKEMGRSALEAYNRITSEGALKEDVYGFFKQTLLFDKHLKSY